MSRRRQLGISGIHKTQSENLHFGQVRSALATKQIHQLQDHLSVFKENLELFANKYKKDIKKEPNFRMHFQKMCQNIGVDPLASNKGFWAELLGVGDFYYQLGIQIIQVCMATRDRNGGLIEIEELKKRVEKLRGRNAQDISDDDITRSIKSLAPLGNGFGLVQLGSKRMVQSVPRELNTDQHGILVLAQGTGRVTIMDVEKSLGWTTTRGQTALDDLLHEGICWIDKQGDPSPEYWVTSFFEGFADEMGS